MNFTKIYIFGGALRGEIRIIYLLFLKNINAKKEAKITWMLTDCKVE